MEMQRKVLTHDFKQAEDLIHDFKLSDSIGRGKRHTDFNLNLSNDGALTNDFKSGKGKRSTNFNRNLSRDGALTDDFKQAVPQNLKATVSRESDPG